MAKIIVNQASLNKAVRDIEKQWAEQATRDQRAYENLGTHMIRNAIRSLRVYDEGVTDKNSQMKQERIGNKIQWSFETNGVPYAPYPRNGLGSSARYGARKYDVKAAADMLARYNLIASVPNPGNPRPPKPRDRNIPPLIQTS